MKQYIYKVHAHMIRPIVIGEPNTPGGTFDACINAPSRIEDDKKTVNKIIFSTLEKIMPPKGDCSWFITSVDYLGVIEDMVDVCDEIDFKLEPIEHGVKKGSLYTVCSGNKTGKTKWNVGDIEIIQQPIDPTNVLAVNRHNKLNDRLGRPHIDLKRVHSCEMSGGIVSCVGDE